MARRIIIPSLVIFLLAAYFFHTIFFYSDLHLHYRFVLKYLSGEGGLPANFLYYYIISLFTFDSTQTISYATIVVLSLSVVLKFITVYWYQYKNIDYSTNYIYFILFSFLLLLITPLYFPQLAIGRYYLGSFTPNVWHNSTTIFFMPFAILLFVLTIRQLSKFEWKRFFLIVLLIIINASIKPSYLFVFVVALPFTLLFTKDFRFNSIVKQVLPVIIAIAVISILKFIIYETDSIYSSNSSIELAPFKVYRAWHKFNDWQLFLQFTTSLLTGVLFPLFVFIKKGVKANDLTSIFSLVSFFSAIVIFVVFVETGYRWNHGNFFWQIVPSTFILFLVAVKNSYAELVAPIRSLKDINLYRVVFFMHVLFGVIYIIRIPLAKTYF